MKTSIGGGVPRVLTIAGSDSGGGAGIQADLKTMHQLGVYGMSVVTAVTAQNTEGVFDIQTMPVLSVQRQMRAVWDDLGVDAVKCGMLATAEIVQAVSDWLHHRPTRNLVVDPVMVAKGGAALLAPPAMQYLRERLMPLAEVVTPNLPEAAALVGYPVETLAQANQACHDIAALGPAYVVVKGGHRAALGGQIIDVVYRRESQTVCYLAAPYIDTPNTHGTGCTFSSALASLLAQGWDTLEAIAGAKAFVSEAILGGSGWTLGHGNGPTNHFAPRPARYRPQWGVVNTYQGGVWQVQTKGVNDDDGT
ncbi:MAG: bifunctional hydroxymethylpyrimidine kinase/phosphomethylpyrimidine kinase [Sulfobacillus acidophilus]|uniref:Hydroxymethylpyrimidine/phosphomethylpyrimidine kinase n=1 Tax=Sulfobacillus acidophilus TaxID=53633 RepID=A0A2T2WMF4_9FIRM|nr:MAG: bifunctional hydroxymethylpyrimidine kinase/phosphomethylpyrimidine kinase [Sulfobacillus acidophilus]